jgi:hypothetical protein
VCKIVNISIEYRIVLQAILKVPWKDEETSCEWLRENKYKVSSIVHQEEYVRIVGEKSFVENKKDK